MSGRGRMIASGEEKWSEQSLKKNLYLCAFALMMNYSAYIGLLHLQSSINIEDGLGTAGITIIYGVSSFSTIFILPFFIDCCGAKVAIIAGEFGILLYTLANFYPSRYTIFPAAVLHGITESASWAGASVYVTFLGKRWYEEDKDRRSKEKSIYSFFSRFHSISYMAQILGNGLVSAVFFGAAGGGVKRSESRNETISSLNGSSEANPEYVSYEELAEDWSSCGPQECQSDLDDETVVSDKYQPAESSVVLLLVIFTSIQVFFTLVHILFLRPIPPAVKLTSKRHGNSDAAADLEQQQLQANTTTQGSRKATSTQMHKLAGSGPSFAQRYKQKLVGTVQHLFSKLHLAVFPSYFLYGFLQAFCVTQFTRAYVSCTIGVSQLGFVMMVYGVSDMSTSACLIKVIPLIGRTITYYLITLLYICTIFYCLYMPLNFSERWPIYLGAILYGSCDAGYQNLMQGLSALYFEKNLAIAYSMKNLVVNLGITMGAFSLFDCVAPHYYLQAGIILFASTTYACAEFLYRSSATKPTSERGGDTADAMVSDT